VPEIPASRTGQLHRGLRQMSLFRHMAPMEALIGWPIPVRHRPASAGGPTAMYLRLPLYGWAQQDGQTRLYPPFAVITLAWPGPGARPRPLDYADLRFTQAWARNAARDPVGTFPHDAVRGTVADYLARRDRLFELYDEMMDALQEHKPFPGPACDEFAGLLRTLMEPALEGYYRDLAPGFCRQFLGGA
jgi:hypothetical protein